MFKSRLLATIGLTLITLAVLSVGVVTASRVLLNGDGEIIRACVNNSSGVLKIIGPDEDCKKNWSLLEWNADGSPGPQGLAGLNCWDLNGNGVPDLPDEDTNNDGVVDVFDCRGTDGSGGGGNGGGGNGGGGGDPTFTLDHFKCYIDLTPLLVSEASRVQLPLQHTPLATCLSTSCGV